MSIYVEVKNNNLELALRKFKKKIKLTNLMQEIKEREFFTKPSIKKRKKKLNAIMRQKYDYDVTK